MRQATLPTVLLTASLLAGMPAVGSDRPGPRGVDPRGVTQVAITTGATGGWGSADTTPPRAWRAPVHPLVVVRRFDPPEQPWLPGHRGVDLRASPDDLVRAAGAGTVAFAAGLAGRGVVVVDHGVLRTTYEPVEATVSVGQRVGAGDPIGVVGTGTGHCGRGECLHLGLRRGRTYLDPLLILRRPVTRLRPW